MSEAASSDATAEGIGIVLARINDRVYRVLTARAEHVGNLQHSNGQWKFKAVGHAPDGAVLPGWGPFTDRHNSIVAAPDATLVNAILSAP